MTAAELIQIANATSALLQTWGLTPMAIAQASVVIAERRAEGREPTDEDFAEVLGEMERHQLSVDALPLPSER